MRRPTCDTCLHWQGDYRGEGECHRRAPVAIPAADLHIGGTAANIGTEGRWSRNRAVWPVTRPDDRCGEHEPKES